MVKKTSFLGGISQILSVFDETKVVILLKITTF